MYINGLNGDSVIAAAILDTSEALVLVELRDRETSGVSYVIATADHPDNNPDEWSYACVVAAFAGHDARTRARRLFTERLAGSWNAS